MMPCSNCGWLHEADQCPKCRGLEQYTIEGMPCPCDSGYWISRCQCDSPPWIPPGEGYGGESPAERRVGDAIMAAGYFAVACGAATVAWIIWLGVTHA